MRIKYRHLVVFGSVTVVVWALGVFLFVSFMPLFISNAFKNAILKKGFGQGPIPINTLYTEPPNLFADPLAPLPASGSNLATVGVNHDTLLTVGWLDLSKGPLVLHVPDFSNRYYSVQLSDPADIDFAYVGTRTTGTQAGNYLITGPTWKGQPPSGMARIASPNNSVLVVGRILVYTDGDVTTAYDLARQISLVQAGG